MDNIALSNSDTIRNLEPNSKRMCIADFVRKVSKMCLVFMSFEADGNVPAKQALGRTGANYDLLQL